MEKGIIIFLVMLDLTLIAFDVMEAIVLIGGGL